MLWISIGLAGALLAIIGGVSFSKTRPPLPKFDKGPEPDPEPTQEQEPDSEPSFQRTFKDGEFLSSDEESFIREHLKCPDCGTGKLLKRPEGGGSINTKCSTKSCGSQFNFGLLTERISDASPNKRPEMVSTGVFR